MPRFFTFCRYCRHFKSAAPRVTDVRRVFWGDGRVVMGDGKLSFLLVLLHLALFLDWLQPVVESNNHDLHFNSTPCSLVRPHSFAIPLFRLCSGSKTPLYFWRIPSQKVSIGPYLDGCKCSHADKWPTHTRLYLFHQQLLAWNSHSFQKGSPQGGSRREWNDCGRPVESNFGQHWPIRWAIDWRRTGSNLARSRSFIAIDPSFHHVAVDLERENVLFLAQTDARRMHRQMVEVLKHWSTAHRSTIIYIEYIW